MAGHQTVQVAILDDYQDVAQPIFASHLSALSAHDTRLTSYPKTLNARDPSDLQKLIAQLQPYHVISSMRERTAFPAGLIEHLPNLRLLLTTGTRNAAIDLDACSRSGVLVVGTSGRCVKLPVKDERSGERFGSLNTTAETTLALLLACAKRITSHAQRLRDGEWQGKDLTVGLGGKTLGVVGFGRIGALVAKMAALGLGMKILAWSENLTQEKADAAVDKEGAGIKVEVAQTKEDLFRRADFVSLHYVLSDRSRGLVGKQELEWMKESAFLVNTSRGGLIDEAEVLEALARRRIAGVGLDVFNVEPLPADSPWRTAERAVLSPHVGYSEEQVITGWYQETAENLVQFLRGETLEPCLAHPHKS